MNKKRIIILSCVIVFLVPVVFYKYQQTKKSQNDLLIEDFYGFEKILEPLFESKDYSQISKVIDGSATGIATSQSELDKNIFAYYQIRKNIELTFAAKQIPSLDSALFYLNEAKQKIGQLRVKLFNGKFRQETKLHWNAKFESLNKEIENYQAQFTKLKNNQ